MKLIVGLGNAGPRYAGTRHNVGFDVADTLASRWRIGMEVEKFSAFFGSGEIHSQRVVLLKPMTLMNRSGRAVLAAGRFYKIELEDLLVIADDLALPVGRLRIRAGGSSGSHKGLQSVIDTLSSQAWSRLRVGIGEAVGDPSVYVLSRFTEDEEVIVRQVRQGAADAVECWIRDGVDSAMTRFNGDVPLE